MAKHKQRMSNYRFYSLLIWSFLMAVLVMALILGMTQKG